MPEQFLQRAESSTVGRKRKHASDGAVDEARAAETNYDEDEPGLYEEGQFRNSVSGLKSKDGKSKKGKLSTARLKKSKAPLIVVLIAIIAIIGFIALAQGMMPFAIVNRAIEEFNTTGFSSVLRSDNILNYQLSSSGSSFGLTDYQRESLVKSTILPVDIGECSDSGANPTCGTVLAYETAKSGEWQVVHGDVPADPNINVIKAKLESTYSSRTFKSLSLITIDEAMNDGHFKNPYTTASRTWRGGNSGWYDTLSSLNEQIRGYTRSRFWYTTTNKLSTSLAGSAKVLGYRKSIAEKAWTLVTGRRSFNEYIGNTIAGTKVGKALGIKVVNPEKIGSAAKIGFSAEAFMNGISQMASVGCKALQMISKAQTLIASIQNMQYLNLASGALEAIQSAQVGDSDGEPMREYMEGLVMNDDTGKNGMMSDGMSALMTGSAINESSPSVQAVSAENAMMSIDKSPTGNIITDALREAATGVTDILSAINTCTNVAAGLNVVSTVMSVAIGVATSGIGFIATAVLKSLVSVAVGAALQPVARALMSWIWDQFASTIAQNVAVDWVGEDLGNALYSSINMYVQSQHQIGSGTPASKESVLGYRREQNRLIAEEAEYQRSIRSPFDTSSQYTFLGSIVYNLIPIATTSGVGNIIKNVSSLMSNSVSAIIPTASAVAETNLALDFGTCPTLESIGASCDKMGRPYIISDTNAISEQFSPDFLINKVYELGGIESTVSCDGTYEVVENSNAEKFLTFCSERLSNWGQADANIMEIITEREKRSHWWAGIPLLGDLIESFVTLFHDDSQDVPWIVGQRCINSPKNTYQDSEGKTINFWETEGKYYQAFFQDQRIMENTGAVKKSSAAVALERYHESYPLDNSAEGILARYSGMTKDDVIATIDYINTMTYLADYQPEERITFGDQEEETLIYYEIPTDRFAIFVALEPRYIVYNTLRNRDTIS